MKAKPEKEISKPIDTNSNLATSYSSSTAIETAINETINLHEKFDLLQLEANQSRNDSIQSKNDLNDSIQDLFEEFMRSYRNLISKITEMKTENYFHFRNIFQTNNLYVIKFYDFVSKLLYKTINFNSEDGFKFCAYSVKMTIELIHVLISSRIK